MNIRIAGRLVGDGHPCFVIAEAGVNHNGDPVLARTLIDLAQAAGADAVKFQTWKTEKLVTRDAAVAQYQRQAVGALESQYSLLSGLELSEAQFRDLAKYAEDAKALFLSTPDEPDSADFLETLDLPAFKIGSGEVTNLAFLRQIARKARPIILSTGMSTLGEVEAAVRAIEAEGSPQLVLLHCVSEYPADPATANLRAMDTLRAAFGYPVGFSNHTPGWEVAVAAVARGACILEKHLTIDKSLPGPDHAASLDGREFTSMVTSLRLVEKALGDGRKVPTANELETRRVVRKSLVATRDLGPGHCLQELDLTGRRAGCGVTVDLLPLVVGRLLLAPVNEGQLLSFEQLDWSEPSR